VLKRVANTLLDTSLGRVQGFRRMEEVQACTAHPAPSLVSCVSAAWPAALAAIRQHAAHDRPVVRRKHGLFHT
jgi:hypothetical protein